MNSFNQILTSLSDQSEMLSLDGFVWVVLFYLVLSWLVCVSGAFLKVRETQFYVGLVSMGLTLVVALMLGGLCRNFLPELAASFTPSGLFIFSIMVGLLVCSVPLIQFFWNISYWRGLACVLCGVGVLATGLVAFQMFAHPVEQLPARLAIPLFQKDAPDVFP
ncbi:hypothetical protein P3T73_06510 [Kiritimatiellota bacterium B12222]|nr:hypothetical protein P3T73_06510 [Kiritimatiellota bacterium B12222]